MSPSQIPWDSPSRYGRAGLAARLALKRLMRPVTLRTEAEQTRLEEELAQVRAEQSTGLAALRDLNHQLAELRLDQVRTNDSLTAADRLLDHTLSQDLPAGARQRRVRIEGATKAICSMGSGNYRGLLSRSAISFEKYARRWDWDLILSTEDLAERRPFPWGKIPLLRALMDEYEWLLWVDADVVMVDIEADITREIREDKNLYLVEHHGTEYHANTGVMLLRSSDWSREFLDEVWALGEIYRDHPWWENAAALVLLGYVLGPHRLVYPTRWLQRTQFLDVRWNSVDIHRADPPVFVHRSIFDLETRSRQITGDLACVLAGAHPLTAGRDWAARPIRKLTDARRPGALPPILRREELPLLLNALGLTATGAEIGVRKGPFSEHLLEYWRGERLISVDPWLAAPLGEYDDESNVSQEEHDSNFAETARRLARFGPRSDIWRCDSEAARARLQSASLDFVYLDARHDEASVREDLGRWWSIVRPGGLLCGHDYVDGHLPNGVFGVRTAVDAFFGQLGLSVHATTEDAPWPSWIVLKPGWLVGLNTAGGRNSEQSHTDFRSTDVTSFDQVLTCLADQERFTLVQIGAFTGETENDPLFRFLRHELPRHPDAIVVLVEPVRDHFKALREAYRDLPGVRFENVAIAESEGERDFFRLAVDPAEHGQAEYLSRVGSLREDRMTALWQGYEQEFFDQARVAQDYAGFWHANRVVERVSCTTITELLDRHQITSLDLLQIDAEGYDHVILRTIDFDRIRPHFINYERVLLGDEEPTCREMLERAGYALLDWGQDTLCIAV